MSLSILAVIPARGGSKGLPGKNLKPFAGLPLIAHTVLFAKMCRDIDRAIVSTDAPEIAEMAKRFGAEVPFLRPAELAQDDTPLWDVVRHAWKTVRRSDGSAYEAVLLLDPTSPARELVDVEEAARRLQEQPEADGIISVSQPDFNPIWHCVIERDGWMVDLHPEGLRYARRQDVPPVYRINGSLYLWRSAFVEREPRNWRVGRHLLYETPELRAMSIDTAAEFGRAELLVKSGLVVLPWLSEVPAQ